MITACLVVIEYDDNNNEVRSYTAYGTASDWEGVRPVAETFVRTIPDSRIDSHGVLPREDEQ